MPLEGDQKVLEFANPVWQNAKGIKDAIGIWDGVAEKALAINQTNHGNFFGLMQQFSLDAAILRVCKVYERTNRNNKKHTAHDLIQYLEDNIQKADLWGYTHETIDFLCISKDLLLKTSSKNSSVKQRIEALADIIAHLKASIPNKEKDSALKKIADFRDKKAAHQERLSQAKQELLSTLPSPEDFIRLATWAEHVSGFVVSFFCNTTLLPHGIPCSRMSTLNVLAKVLDKDFNDIESEDQYKEYFDFYGIK